MSKMKRLVSVFSTIAMLLATATAFADEDYPVRVVSVQSSPVAITNCKVRSFFTPYANVVNRTSHQLLSVTVQYKAYDADNTPIGSADIMWSPDPPLVAGDSNLYGGNWQSMSLSEPQSAVEHFTCRVMAATFTGKRTWQYGHTWGEHLSPVDSEGGSGGGGGDDMSRQTHSTVSLANAGGPVKIEVIKAWNDNDGVNLYVHDQIAVTAGSQPASIAPYQLVLTMKLANGAEKGYQGLNEAAPDYLKFDPVTRENVKTPEIDPNTDFGKVGRMIVPANGTMNIIVTFRVSDSVADATQNTQVAVDRTALAPAPGELGNGDRSSSSDRSSSDRSSSDRSSTDRDSNSAHSNARATPKPATKTPSAPKPTPHPTKAPNT